MSLTYEPFYIKTMVKDNPRVVTNASIKNDSESLKDLPTILELNAHDNLHSLIQPAITHLIKVYTHFHNYLCLF